MISTAPEPGNRITIFDICFFAPEVAEVIRRARYSRRGDWRAYRSAKSLIARHVGWHARLPYLQSSYAYELAIAALVDATGTWTRPHSNTRKAK